MPADTGGCAAIVLGLPEYFTDDVGEKIATSMRTHPAWVVTNSGGLAGFVIVDRRSVRAAEILWMAVAAELRGSGVGTLLLDHVLGDLVEDGLQLVEAKTLRSSRQTDGCGVMVCDSRRPPMGDPASDMGEAPGRNRSAKITFPSTRGFTR